MRESIREVAEALKVLDRPDPWSADIKATDDFLDPLFKRFFGKLGLPIALRKSEYHVLARFLPKEKIDREVTEKLDALVAVAQSATPRTPRAAHTANAGS